MTHVLATLLVLALSLAAFALLLKVEIPALRRRLTAPGHPYFLLLEVGFIMGLLFIAFAPLGYFAPGTGVWQAAIMTGFSILALAGFSSFYLVHIRRLRP